MSNFGWTNDQGEPIMDGAAYRFEQALDDDYAQERARMAYDEDFYADYPDECDHTSGDGTFLGSQDDTVPSGQYECICGEVIGTWTLDRETGWPERDE